MPQVKTQVRRAQDAASSALSDAQATGKEAVDAFRDVADTFGDAIDDSLKRRPYATLAVAAGIGFLFGAAWIPIGSNVGISAGSSQAGGAFFSASSFSFFFSAWRRFSRSCAAFCAAISVTQAIPATAMKNPAIARHACTAP